MKLWCGGRGGEAFHAAAIPCIVARRYRIPLRNPQGPLAGTENWPRTATAGLWAPTRSRPGAGLDVLAGMLPCWQQIGGIPRTAVWNVDDFNTQLHAWPKRAIRRVHATTRMVPAEQIYEDRGSMSAFPRCCPTRRCAWPPACPGTTTCESTPTTSR